MQIQNSHEAPRYIHRASAGSYRRWSLIMIMIIIVVSSAVKLTRRKKATVDRDLLFARDRPQDEPANSFIYLSFFYPSSTNSVLPPFPLVLLFHAFPPRSWTNCCRTGHWPSSFPSSSVSQTWTLVIWLREFSSYTFAQIYAMNSHGHNFCSILVINLRPSFQIFKICFYLHKNYSWNLSIFKHDFYKENDVFKLSNTIISLKDLYLSTEPLIIKI